MLSAKVKFVSVEEVNGNNKDTGKPFHFANIILSDGLESKKFSLALHLVQQAQSLKRKQDIQVETDEVERGFNHQITVNQITVL